MKKIKLSDFMTPEEIKQVKLVIEVFDGSIVDITTQSAGEGMAKLHEHTGNRRHAHTV